MKVLGYSERGIINSFIYEMSCMFNNNSNNPDIFNGLIELIKPMIGEIELPKFKLKNGAIPTIIVEPSFSDFGDADIVILFEDDNIGNTVLFVEAKVCAQSTWDINKNVLGKFTQGINAIANTNPNPLPNGYTSNLLIQLYHKFMMIEMASSNEYSFPTPISPKLSNGKSLNRSIGDNQTVREIFDRIKKHLATNGEDINCLNVFFIGILPSDIGLPINPLGLPIDLQNKLGYITWGEIHELANHMKMRSTIAVFDLNQKISTDDLFSKKVLPSSSDKNQIYNP